MLCASSTLVKKPGTIIISSVRMGTEEGSGFTYVRGKSEYDAEMLRMVLVSRFSKADKNRRGCKRYRVILEATKTGTLQETRGIKDQSLKPD